MWNKIAVEESKINTIIKRNQDGESIRGLSREFGIQRIVLKRVFREVGYTPITNSHPKEISIPPTDLEKYAARYNDGESLKEISKSTPFCSSTLGRKLEGIGIKLRPQYPTLTANELKDLVVRYKNGNPLSDISYATGHGEEFIKKNLLNAGVKLRTASECIKLAHQKDGAKWKRKCSVDETVFDTITEESAYWIGFFMADGCIHNTSIMLTLQRKDIEHIEKFKKFLKSSHPISTGFAKSPTSDKVYPNASFSISSVKIVKRLKTFGVIPAKSIIAKVKKLEFNRHFWRGVIDGDGTVGLFKRGNTAYISLVGSRDLMTQFLNFVKSIVNTKTKLRTCNKDGRTYAVSLSSQKASQVISVLYNDCNIYLNRKYETVQKIKVRRTEINGKKNALDKLTNKIAEMYSKGNSGLEIEKELGVSTSAVYEHLNRYEKLTGNKIARRHTTRQPPTSIRYRAQGLCKDCGAKTALNRSRCEFHLEKCRDYWRRKKIEKNQIVLL